MRLAFAGDVILSKIFQNPKLPLNIRYFIWFIDNILWFDWRFARNRLTQIFTETLQSVHIPKKLLALLGFLVLLWWLSPIPEGAILLALLTGSTVQLNLTTMQLPMIALITTYQPSSWFIETYILPIFRKT
jgi:hypothetical protein